MVIIRADDVQVLHVLLDDVVDLALPKHVVVAVVGERAPSLGLRLGVALLAEHVVLITLISTSALLPAPEPELS